MKKVIISAVLAFALFTITYAANSQEHPMEMGKKECITCHSDPDTVDNTSVVSEYNQSIHSFAGVACGNCHGDEENFRAKPTKASCEPCHSVQVANVNSKLACESCHIAHTYNVHMPQVQPPAKK